MAVRKIFGMQEPGTNLIS